MLQHEVLFEHNLKRQIWLEKAKQLKLEVRCMQGNHLKDKIIQLLQKNLVVVQNLKTWIDQVALVEQVKFKAREEAKKKEAPSTLDLKRIKKTSQVVPSSDSGRSSDEAEDVHELVAAPSILPKKRAKTKTPCKQFFKKSKVEEGALVSTTSSEEPQKSEDTFLHVPTNRKVPTRNESPLQLVSEAQANRSKKVTKNVAEKPHTPVKNRKLFKSLKKTSGALDSQSGASSSLFASFVNRGKFTIPKLKSSVAAQPLLFKKR